MDNFIKKVIKISKVEAIKKRDTEDIIGANIFETVNDKEVKYALWFTKKDGEPTKAYTQFKSQMVGIGSEIGIAYTEEPNQFTYTDKKTGEKKEATSTNRKITWFSEPGTMEEYAEQKKLTLEEEKVIDDFGTDDVIDCSKIPF